MEPAARVVVLGEGAVTDTVKVLAVLTQLRLRRDSVTLSLAEINLQINSSNCLEWNERLKRPQILIIISSLKYLETLWISVVRNLLLLNINV